MTDPVLPDQAESELVTAARTGIGDSLRSVVYFTPDSMDLLYVRSDLRPDDDQARFVEGGLVESERVGFDDRETYNKASARPDSEPEIGAYEFTIRVFEDGFVNRVISGDRGILLITDGLDVAAFEQVAVSIRTLLEGLDEQ